MKEYIPLLMEKKKKFLILGNMNHATFKEIFHYFMDDELWLGYKSGHFWFKVPEYYEEKKKNCHGKIPLRSSKGIEWLGK